MDQRLPAMHTTSQIAETALYITCNIVNILTITLTCEILFFFLLGPKIMYKGRETEVTLENLTPNTTFYLKLRASSIGDDSPFSEVVAVTTGWSVFLFGFRP